MDYIKLANNGIQQLKPYEPGKPIEELERELGVTDIVKLAVTRIRWAPATRLFMPSSIFTSCICIRMAPRFP